MSQTQQGEAEHSESESESEQIVKYCIAWMSWRQQKKYGVANTDSNPVAALEHAVVEKVSKLQLGIVGRSGLGLAAMSEKPGFAEHSEAAERIRISF